MIRSRKTAWPPLRNSKLSDVDGFRIGLVEVGVGRRRVAGRVREVGVGGVRERVWRDGDAIVPFFSTRDGEKA